MFEEAHPGGKEGADGSSQLKTVAIYIYAEDREKALELVAENNPAKFQEILRGLNCYGEVMECLSEHRIGLLPSGDGNINLQNALSDIVVDRTFFDEGELPKHTPKKVSHTNRITPLSDKFGGRIARDDGLNGPNDSGFGSRN